MESPTSDSARRVIIGLNWADVSPRVRVRDGESSTSALQPLVGLKLNYRTSAEATRRCLGYAPFHKSDADHVDCSNPPEPGGRKCRSCAIVDATFASNLHHAHTKDRADIVPAIAEHLRQPNVLYLATFRDGSIKVGTSTEKRRDKRLAEQGAWRAAIVARADDGYAVRVVEDAVTAELGLPQSVSIGRKLDGMVAPKPTEALDAALGEASSRVRELLLERADPKLRPVDDLWTFPGSGDPDWIGLHPYPIRLDSGSHDLEVSAACGRMTVVGRPGESDRFVADLGQLFGVEFALGDYESDELAVQDALF